MERFFRSVRWPKASIKIPAVTVGMAKMMDKVPGLYSSDGYSVTNKPTSSRADKSRSGDGRRKDYTAAKVWDRSSDVLALIKVEGAFSFSFAPKLAAARARIGDWVTCSRATRLAAVVP